MGTHYKHLTEDDLLSIDSMLLLGYSQRAVAQAKVCSGQKLAKESCPSLKQWEAANVWMQ